MTKKAANYSAEDIAVLEEGYNPEADQDTRKRQVTALANALGRKEQSIVAKLVNLDLYVKLETVTKTGEKPKSKEVRVNEIADDLGIDASLLDSLSKANVSVVKMVQELVTENKALEHNLDNVMSTVSQYFNPETGEEVSE